MKFSLSSLCKSSTPWLLGLSLIVSALNEGHAAKPARPKPCASKMAQKATNRVTADNLNIGHTNKTWTMVAGEFILNIKEPDGKFPTDSARIDIKIIEDEIKDPYSAVVGCSTFPKNEADGELPFHFGVISFDDKSGDATHSAVIVIDLKKKGTRLEPYEMPTSGLSMVNMLKEKFTASPSVAIKSLEIYKNSDSEIVIRSAGTHEELEEMEVITVQKFVLR